MRPILLCLFVLISPWSFSQLLDERIKEIRAEYAKVNSEVLVATVKDIEDQSTEGGELKVFRNTTGVRKIEATYYGETGKIVEEYYVKEGKLFFSFIRRYVYNRPIYYDAETAAEMGDTEAFDESKTVVKEYRYYFSSEEKLIRYIDDQKKTFHDFPEKEEMEKKVVGDFREVME